MIERLMTTTRKNESGSEENAVMEDTDAFVVRSGDDAHDDPNTWMATDATTKAISTQTTSQVTSPFDYWGRCERARAILESMELFQPLQDGNTGLLSIPLPVPSYETYFHVLQMYSSKHLALPHGITTMTTAESSIAKRMQEAPRLAQSIVKRMEATQNLALQPSAMHWNHVLSAYANSNRLQRPLEAASLLYELDTKNLTNESSFSHVLRCCVEVYDNKNNNSNRRSQNQQQLQQRKFAEVSIEVAQRVWKGLKQRTIQGDKNIPRESDHLSILLNEEFNEAHNKKIIQLRSYHFLHMLRVARNFAVTSVDSTSVNQRQVEWIRTILLECIQYQKVNIHVILEVVYQAKEMAGRCVGEGDELDWIAKVLPTMDTTSFSTSPPTRPNLLDLMDSFKVKNKQAISRSPSRMAKIFLRQCPPEWRAKAD